MAIPFGLLVFLVGIAYGWLSPGRQSKGHILKMGIIWGLIAAIVIAVLAYYFQADPLGLGNTGFVSLFVSFVIMTLVFVVGVWLGDLLPGGSRQGSGPRRG